jgi:hypothetical protein
MNALLAAIVWLADVAAPVPRPEWASRCGEHLEQARRTLGRGGEIVFLPRERGLWWSHDTLELRIGDNCVLRIEKLASARPTGWWDHERDRLPLHFRPALHLSREGAQLAARLVARDDDDQRLADFARIGRVAADACLLLARR